MQFVVHVASSIDMDAGGDERDHHEHQHCDRVDVPADRKPERTTRIKRVPVARVGHRLCQCKFLLMTVAIAMAFRSMVFGIGMFMVTITTNVRSHR